MNEGCRTRFGPQSRRHRNPEIRGIPRAHGFLLCRDSRCARSHAPPWECRLCRSAALLAGRKTRSVEDAIPTLGVGTRVSTVLPLSERNIGGELGLAPSAYDSVMSKSLLRGLVTPLLWLSSPPAL